MAATEVLWLFEQNSVHLPLDYHGPHVSLAYHAQAKRIVKFRYVFGCAINLVERFGS